MKDNRCYGLFPDPFSQVTQSALDTMRKQMEGHSGLSALDHLLKEQRDQTQRMFDLMVPKQNTAAALQSLLDMSSGKASSAAFDKYMGTVKPCAPSSLDILSEIMGRKV